MKEDEFWETADSFREDKKIYGGLVMENGTRIIFGGILVVMEINNSQKIKRNILDKKLKF